MESPKSTKVFFPLDQSIRVLDPTSFPSVSCRANRKRGFAGEPKHKGGLDLFFSVDSVCGR